MRLRPAVVIALVAPLLSWSSFSACSSPQSSGSKTSWFRACDSSAACGEEGACICGICTLPCSAQDTCEEGRCGTELASASTCVDASEAPTRICLPEYEATEPACDELAIAVDRDLGEALDPSCDVPGALACESFDGPLPEETSTWITGEIEAHVQNCLVRSGVGAARFRAAGTEDTALVQTRTRLVRPLESGSFHARVFVYIPAETILPEQVILFELWKQEDELDAQRTALLLAADGTPKSFIGTADTTLLTPSEFALPRDQWVCVELSQTLDDVAGRVVLSVDGQPASEETGIDTLPDSPFIVSVTSAHFTHGAQEAEIYVDDFVLATQPVGCD